ncbi:hypothetical protein ACJX0J_028415, partial [Zea mays]
RNNSSGHRSIIQKHQPFHMLIWGSCILNILFCPETFQNCVCAQIPFNSICVCVCAQIPFNSICVCVCAHVCAQFNSVSCPEIIPFNSICVCVCAHVCAQFNSVSCPEIISFNSICVCVCAQIPFNSICVCVCAHVCVCAQFNSFRRGLKERATFFHRRQKKRGLMLSYFKHIILINIIINLFRTLGNYYLFFNETVYNIFFLPRKQANTDIFLYERQANALLST